MGSPGGADTTAPAAITDLSVMTAARSLVLQFTATGDDVNSGTASRYDVRYKLENSGCAAPEDGSWTVAPRGDVQKPIAAGNADAFTIRVLSAGSNCCVAIRVRDEVPNFSAWVVDDALTEGIVGDWPMVAIPPDLSASPTPADLSAEGFVAVSDELPATGEPRILAVWGIADQPIASTTNHRVGIRFAALSAPIADGAPIQVCSGSATSDCAETILLSDALLSAHIDALSAQHFVAPIPGPGAIAGILVRGTKTPAKRSQWPEDRTVLLERTAGGWTSARVPFVVGAGSGGVLESTFTYVPDGAGGFNPVLTWVNGGTLSLAERVNGNWESTSLFSRSSGGFPSRRVFITPDGDLGVWVDAQAGSTNPAIYAVRSPAGAGGWWTYYDAGPKSANGSASYATGFDAAAKLVVATTNDGPVSAIHQGDFKELGGAPSASLTSIVPQGAWIVLESPVSGVTFRAMAGLAADPCDVAMHVATRNFYPLPTSASIPELRLASVTTTPGTSSAVDHVSSGTPAVVPLPNGDVAILTSWTHYGGNPVRFASRPLQDVYLMRGLVGSCPPTP